jgi:cell division transport system permease protein
MPSVTGVDYGEQAVERLSSIARAVRWAGWVAFIVLVGATLIIVSATLQLAIYARREEVEIQKLVGATDRFVQAPFLLEGSLQGLTGAALAIVGLVAFRQTLSPQLASLLSFLRLPGSVADARPWMEALQLALAGAGLGLAGSFLAVHRFLRA